MQHSYDESDIIILAKNPLFDGIYPSNELLNSIFAKKTIFIKDEIVVHEGFDLHNLGIVLKGTATAYKTDLSGKSLVIAKLAEGNIFGGILSLGRSQKSPVSVAATSELTVLLISTHSIVDGLGSKFDTNNRLLRNLLGIISKKYFELHERINAIMRPTLREKILFYLDSCAKETGGNTFTIPFNRQALAEYLNADRSALSRELSKMKKEGLVDFCNESFRLIKS